ncbi:hypothetical protein DL546_007964 [Coniochaeta pulveracea]|uniref:Methyltransferase domain-containing protein n=1 Tax=Coniochaeta pulveracea TaxID=177199 RepID=A0A420YG04_9PEZI|nr:hypothetical protein DL546_007964 [Coniochaeta pulveracea]
MLNHVSRNSDSQSLSESIAVFQKENGRTYHAYRAGSYHFPNDPTEAERLDEQHAMLQFVMGGRNYLAPLSHVKPPQRILDIATGTGAWAIEMGDEFPESEITGTDLSPIQPEYVPPNVRFFVEDSADEWDYCHNFDYIHARMTVGCWSDYRSQVLAQAFAHLNPGGYFEAQEINGILLSDDHTIPPYCPIVQWTDEINAASKQAHRDVTFAPLLKGWMEKAGFVDVHEHVFKIPLNGWPIDSRLKHIGMLWQRNMLNGLSAFSLGLLSRFRGRTKEEIELELVGVRRDLFDPRMHAYQRFYVVWGRKPMEGECT